MDIVDKLKKYNFGFVELSVEEFDDGFRCFLYFKNIDNGKYGDVRGYGKTPEESIKNCVNDMDVWFD